MVDHQATQAIIKVRPKVFVLCHSLELVKQENYMLSAVIDLLK